MIDLEKLHELNELNKNGLAISFWKETQKRLLETVIAINNSLMKVHPFENI